MKKYLNIFLALIFLSFQSYDIKKEIIGEWDVKQVDNKNMKVEPFNKKKLSSNASYIFTKDGTVMINSSMHDNVSGTFTIKNDSIILNYMWPDDDVSEHFKILEIKSGKMVLEQSFKDWGTLITVLQKVR